jgi:hypothetical protein
VIDVLIRAVAVGVGVQLGRELANGACKSRRTPPGWYLDPWKQHRLRYWDKGWTGFTSD